MNKRNLVCPACNNNLVEFVIDDLSVDICKGGCAGIWFDKHELNRVDEKAEREGLILLNIEKNPEILIDYEKTRKCPVCENIDLRKHFWCVKEQVEIDECDKCGGIWLDSGELEAIRSLYENEEEKLLDEEAYFKKLSSELIDKALQEERENQRKKAKWFDKLAYTIFGI